MNSMRIAFVACVALFASTRISAQTSTPDIPRTVSYQGLLAGADGKALNGPQTITVQLFGDADGKQLLWEDAFSADLHNGVFDLQLGSHKPLPDATTWHGPMWIAVKVGEGAPSGLSQLTASPYAMTVANNSITADKMATDYVGSIAVNGQKISGKGSNVNLVAGDGLQLNYDATTNAIVLSGATTSGTNGKGGTPSSDVVHSLTGTANQVLVAGTYGVQKHDDLTLTLPQDIATTSSPSFNNLTLSGNAEIDGVVTLDGLSHLSTAASVSGILAVDASNHVGYRTPAEIFTAAANNWILNQTTASQAANFKIGGSGVIGTTLTVGGNTSVGGTLGVTGATTLGSSLNMSSNSIHNVTDPSSAQDAATKNYVDNSVNAEAAARTSADNTLTTNLNQEISDRQTAITNEANARTSADNTLQSNIDAEAAARTAADNTLTTNLNQEISDRQTAITNEANARTSADNTLQSNIDAEAAARTSADNTLTTNLNQEIADRQTAVTNEANARTSADNTLQSNIDAEAAARTAADNTLTTNLNQEISDRQAAVTNEANARTSANNTLQSNIDAEAASRTVGDNTLTTNLNQEIADRQTAITNEANARTSADNTLQSNIDAEAAARTSADNTLTTNLNNETAARQAADAAESAARQAADATLTTNLNNETAARQAADAAETAARQAADATLTTNLNNEAAARTASDANLQSQINTKANDDAVVHLANTETITGTKNFTQNINMAINKEIGYNVDGDHFTYDGKSIGHYSMGFYNDSWNSSGTGWLSAYAGFKLFSAGALMAIINGNTAEFWGQLQANGGLDMLGHPITTVGTPVNATDAATKGYVDNGIAAATGNNYIQNGTSQQTANFNISGNGTVGGLLAANGNIASSGNMTVYTGSGSTNLTLAAGGGPGGSPATSSGGSVSLYGGNAGGNNPGSLQGGSGGNVTIKAGDNMPQGGAGYTNLGPAGTVSITGGGGYNSVGGAVTIKAGPTSPWGVAIGSHSDATLEGGYDVAQADAASIVAEGGHLVNLSRSNGGNLVLTSGVGQGSGSNGTIQLVGNSSIAGTLSTTGNINTSGTYQLGGSTVLSTTGTRNVFAGALSGASPTTGGDNAAVGYNALNHNTSADANAVLGSGAMQNNTTAGWNVAVGANALTTQSYAGSGPWTSANVAVGMSALQNNQPTSTSNGFQNTGVGTFTLQSNTTGSDNAAFGYDAGQAGTPITTGNQNTLLGANAQVNSATAQNRTAIGYSAVATADNTIQLGNTNVTNVNTSGAITAGGAGSFGGALNMNSHAINNVTNPTNAQDAATKNYVDNAVAANNVWTVSGGTASTADNVNISSASNGYEIAGNTVLHASSSAGNYSVAVGVGASAGGVTNTAMGYSSMQTNGSSGDVGNTAIGVTSLASLGSGGGSDYNTAIGREAGYNVENGHASGGRNTFLGADADVGPGSGYANITNATAVGFQAIVGASNTIQLGNTSVTNVNTSGAITAGGAGSFGGALNMNSHAINNVTNPTNAQDAATKNYVDNAVSAKANDNAVVHLANTETISGAKTFSSNTEFGGKIHAQWGQVSPSSLDDASGPLGEHGIVENTSGDLLLRAWWGVAIDKEGGLANPADYTYGSLAQANSFAVRTRTSSTAFRTDFFIDGAGNTGIGTTSPQQKLEVNGTVKTEGDVYLTDHTKGIILKDANNNCWRVTVNTNGSLSTTELSSCPN